MFEGNKIQHIVTISKRVWGGVTTAVLLSEMSELGGKSEGELERWEPKEKRKYGRFEGMRGT